MNSFRNIVLILITTQIVVTSDAQWSANVGWASNYHYRGIFQSDSSVSGGIDFSSNGIYVGTWVADVGDGLEVDGYFGYGGRSGDVSYGIGFTGYYYTGDFDDTYQEANLSAGYRAITADVAIGQYDNFSEPTLDYIFYSITVEYRDFYGKVGSFSEEFDGEYFELGYGTTINSFDFGVAVIFATDNLIGESDESLVLTIGKLFDF